jgi:hypothetical protein
MPNLNLTPLQLMIVEKLQYGAEHAVTGRMLAKWLGQKDDRLIREQIRILISLKWPVLSSVAGKKGGYYMANSKEEVEGYAKDLHGRAMEILVREKDLKRAAKTITKPHQLNMTLGIKT